MGLKIVLCLAVFSVFSLLAAGVAGSEPWEVRRGLTADRFQVEFELDRGRPVSLYAQMELRCTWAEGNRVVRWTSRAGMDAAFRWAPPRLHVEQRVDGEYDSGHEAAERYVLDARFGEDGITGTVRMTESLSYGGTTTEHRCWTGKVSFRVPR